MATVRDPDVLVKSMVKSDSRWNALTMQRPIRKARTRMLRKRSVKRKTIASVRANLRDVEWKEVTLYRAWKT